MNTKILFVAVLFMVGLLVGLVLAKPLRPAQKECNDKRDNDGDGYIDLADPGCDNKNDNDESNCGDGVCEGGETPENCPEDCGPANTCNDTDGGFVPTVQGTVSGYFQGEPYSYTDYCVAANSTLLVEYYCLGTQWQSYTLDCFANQTGYCQDGACL